MVLAAIRSAETTNLSKRSFRVPPDASAEASESDWLNGQTRHIDVGSRVPADPRKASVRLFPSSTNCRLSQRRR